MNGTLSLKKEPGPQQPAKKYPGQSHLNHWEGKTVKVMVPTGDWYAGKLESVAKFDVMMVIDGVKTIIHKQHIVMCDLQK